MQRLHRRERAVPNGILTGAWIASGSRQDGPPRVSQDFTGGVSIHARPDVLPHVLDQPGARCGIAGGTLFAGAAVCTAVPLHGWSGVLALLLLTAAWCRLLPRRHAVGLAVAGWAFATGFAVNDTGQLTFAAADLARLALYAATAVLVAGAE